jgi:hypothetical protein
MSAADKADDERSYSLARKLRKHGAEKGIEAPRSSNAVEIRLEKEKKLLDLDSIKINCLSDKPLEALIEFKIYQFNNFDKSENAFIRIEKTSGVWSATPGWDYYFSSESRQKPITRNFGIFDDRKSATLFVRKIKDMFNKLYPNLTEEIKTLSSRIFTLEKD